LVSPNRPFIHRDLSWIQFNERVLAEARSSANPWLERAKFLAITASNFDEFFMIRYASLDRTIRAAERRGRAGPLIRVRNTLLEMTASFTAKQSETLDLLTAGLAARGIRIVTGTAVDEATASAARALVEKEILPRLPPPSPFRPTHLRELENGKLGVLLADGSWIRVPRSTPTTFFVDAPSGPLVFFLDHLLMNHFAAPVTVRLTRDGDIPMDLDGEDPESVPDLIRTGLGSRDRGRLVRLQYSGTLSPETIGRFASVLRLSPRQFFPAPGTLHLAGLWSVVHRLPARFRDDTALAHPPLRPFTLAGLREIGGLFDRLKQKDILLHLPYESFDGYVNFIRAAAEDPAVERIQQTVYRMDAASPVIGLLKDAARRKSVRVLIELRARFDEMNNLRLADDLRQAGVEVAFGFGRLKVHAKVAVVTRREGDVLRHYTHLSTGNYNAATARQYEDLAILTADPTLGADACRFLDAVCRGEVPRRFDALLPAPSRLHRRLLQLIDAEIRAARAGRSAYLFAKVNALVDEGIIGKLYAASRAGVTVDLVVRGACSLIPGVPGLSENIRVVSLVDRFLEHSRIYFFAHSNRIYLSSADWMPRNFFSRLELAFPVLDDRLHRYIREIVIPVYLADTVKGRELTAQGTWKRRTTACTQTPRFRRLSPAFAGKAVRAQAHFEALAAKAYRDTPLSSLPME
jgi:polyphosphate kinase